MASEALTRISSDPQSGFYDWPAIKILLFEYELELKNSSKTNRTKISWNDFANEDLSDHVTIEHIYPQRARKPCWTDKIQLYDDRERGILRHSLGNLVPLSQPKNSSLQNK